MPDQAHRRHEHDFLNGPPPQTAGQPGPFGHSTPENGAIMTTTDPVKTQNRRRTRRLALAASLTAVILPVTAASGDTSTGSQSGEREARRTLHFEVRFSPFNLVDVPPSAGAEGDYRPGDYVTFSDTLLDRSGQRVGTEAGSGLITRVSDSAIQLVYTMTVRLHGRGQISAQGLSSSAPTKHLAVTGGTGRFIGAEGYLDLVERSDGTGSLDVTLVDNS